MRVVFLLALACAAFAARTPVFFDQDSLAGGSNVLSLAMALLHPDLDVVGIGVIAGDSSIDDAVYATLQVVEACGKKVPVARGAGQPFLNSREDVYGRIGLYGPKGGDGWLGEWRRDDPPRGAVPRGQVRRIPGLADPSIKEEPIHAAELLVRLAREHDGRLVLLTAGPLTNVALAVHLAPDIVHRIAAVYTMAGALHVRSKFNFWWDAESAAVFLRQNWREKVLVTIDVSEKTKFTRDLLARAMPESGAVRTWLEGQFSQSWAELNLPAWDELTVAALVDKGMEKSHELLHIGVDFTWGPSYGATLFWNASRADNGGGHVPHWAHALKPWRVLTDVDVPRFERLFCDTMRQTLTQGKTDL
jgi:purine nucleosidase